jgi:hypothetical protein
LIEVVSVRGLPVESELLFSFGSQSQRGVVKLSLKDKWDNQIRLKNLKLQPLAQNSTTDVKVDLTGPVFAECKDHLSPFSSFQIFAETGLLATGNVTEIIE